MLNGISWGQFFLVAGALLAVYYLILFAPWKKARRLPGAAYQPAPADSDEPEEELEYGMEVAANDNNELGGAEDLAGRLREIIAQTGLGNFIREVLLAELQEEIALYPFLNNEKYRPAFNELVRGEVQKKCAVTLSERELDGLWE